jgi:hypothetical protein
MSLKQQIISLLDTAKEQMTMQEIYEKFPETAKTTVRGRVYDSLGCGIFKIAKGLYISQKAIVEQGSSLEIIDRMLKEEEKYDFIFLDIPYEAGGQKGGNRDLSTYCMISPEEFGVFIAKCEKLLKTDTSPLLFMFTSGKSSRTAHDRYFMKILDTPLKPCERMGTFQKLWGNGNPMNMGKHIMPKENIYIFSRSGQVDNLGNWELDFSLKPDLKLYPTAKPYAMIRKLVEQGTKFGDWVFDPFAGSGAVLKACIELGRKCFTADKSDISIQNHLLPLLA